LLKLMAFVVPVFRELADISYLWTVPHVIDGTRLASAIGELPHTPLDQAMTAALTALGIRRRAEGAK
jgi:hypothetical protein